MPGRAPVGGMVKLQNLFGTVTKLRCTMEESAVCTAGTLLQHCILRYPDTLSPISQSSSTIQLTGLGQWKTINHLLEVDGLMPGLWLLSGY